MTKVQRISTGYRPRPLQAEIHRNLKRFNVLVCHRRFGKTVLCINELLDRALSNPSARPRYAYVAPLYRQAKQVAWDYLKHYAVNLPHEKHEGELRLDFPTAAGGAARIQLLGADNPDSLRGIYLDGVVLDEYAQMPPRIWGQVVRPALADREGWAIFIGTPNGRNGLYDIYRHATQADGWYATVFRASDTGIVPANELAAARRDMSEEEYAQEFECSFDAAIVGSYYAAAIAEAERDGRVGNVPWDPAVSVDTAWDLGIGDSTVIWFLQQVGKEIHWIDYYECAGVGLDHYAKVVRDKPYVYGDHIAPHDARARELGTGRTRLETLARLGIKMRVVPRQSVDDGINAVRNLLPRSWFDASRCEGGLDALRQYRRQWDQRAGTFRATPFHDWTSHAADAARTAALGLRRSKGGTALPGTAESDYAIFRH